MEGLFAEAKNFHGLGRARFRRRHNMQIQAYMIATVQNLKRMVRVLNNIIDFLHQTRGLVENRQIAKLACEFFRKLSTAEVMAA